jgi:hypothetical protein
MTDKPSMADQIAGRYASYFEHPGEVMAVLLGLCDVHERADAATVDLQATVDDDLCECKPLLLERLDRPNQPVCWVHTIACEVAQDPEALDSWSQHVSEWMAQQRGKPIILVTGQVTARAVLARLSAESQ